MIPKKIYLTDGIFESSFPFNQCLDRNNAFISVEWLKEQIAKISVSELNYDEVVWKINRDELLKAIEEP